MPKLASDTRLFFFYDDELDSQEVKRLLEQRDEKCYFVHVKEFRTAAGEQVVAPTLYAPEGVFEGIKHIKAFLGIPDAMRYHKMLARATATR